MPPTNARLNLERLGSRILPSANSLIGPPVAADSAVHAAGKIAAPVTASDSLDGTVQGTLKQFTGIPADIGLRFALNGSGKLGGLDTFSVKGVLHGTGFLAKGEATGVLTLTNRHGSVTLKLQGPEQPGFAALPARFHFTVVAGDGAYKNLHESGDVTLTTKAHGTATEFRLVFA